MEMVTVTIMDEDGKLVARADLGAHDTGEHVWTWDGTNVHGNPVDEGKYTFKVTGKDSAGNDVYMNPLLVGEVDEMSYVTGTPTPSIDGTPFSISNILRVETGGNGEEETTE